MDRVKTGIDGLDDLIEGGFPRGRSVLLAGGCGCGKSIFCMQYLYKGAVDYGEPGIYVTTDENAELLREDMLRFGWDLAALEKANKLVMMDLSHAKIGVRSPEELPFDEKDLTINRLILQIMKTADQIGARRIAIDSLPSLELHLAESEDIRTATVKLCYMLRRSGLTSIITTEVPEQSMATGAMKFSKNGTEEFLTDGVILLHYLGIGTGSNRTLYIRKMRSTKHKEDLVPLEISQKGIKLTKPEDAFRL